MRFRKLRIAWSIVCGTISALLLIIWAVTYGTLTFTWVPMSEDAAAGALIYALFAATPWIFQRWRFSLRTLLIVTTLVAVVLGLAVWAVR